LEESETQPFSELPEALVEEMLGYTNDLASSLLKSLNAVKGQRDQIRSKLAKKDLLVDSSDLIGASQSPTCSGVDGSYAIERLVTTDLVVAVALAVEGLTPPSEKRFWPRPHHKVITRVVPHNDATSLVLRALMIAMEIELAAQAPHDVTFIDGSMATPIIYLNQGLTNLWNAPIDLSEQLSSIQSTVVDRYAEILRGERSDKAHVAVPKYTSKREIATFLEMPDYEDRGLLMFVLRPGELTRPMEMEPPRQPYHLPVKSPDLDPLLKNAKILYYRPYGHIPPLRLEVPPTIANNSRRLGLVLEAVRLQCGSPGMFEPYPLYLADRMAKHLAVAMPAIRRATTQQMVSAWPDDIGDVYLSMHGYRTENGAR
jgi:hypothetical protein